MIDYIFSPLYLVIGCAFPLFYSAISPYQCSKLFLLLGVIFLAFGDTAAAIIGKKFGKTYLSITKNSKTI